MPTTLLALEYIPRGDINNWDIREDANKDKIDLILGTQHNVTTGAHDTITPETASTGSIGSLAKPYANLYVDAVPTPTQAVQPANKEYVDSVVNGLDWQNSVLSKTLTTPPGSPIQGDRYIIAVGATGAWAGQDNNVTEYNGTSWDFFTVNKGFATWVEAENVNYTWNGTAWVKFGSTVTHANLIGLSADDHPQYYNQARGDARYLQLTGGTVDNLTIAPTSGTATLVVNAASGTSNARIQLQDAGIVRWALVRSENFGDFRISRYDNTGTIQDNSFVIDDVTGNISVAGTINGRDISVDGAKLDGIEAGATADQIASEVPNTPAGNIAATDVQAAINELDTEKQALLGFTPENVANKATAGGYASLDSNSEVVQLPAGAAAASAGTVLQQDGSWITPPTSVAPTGVIQMYGGASAPSGYLLCDGSSYSTTTYATLFAVIGYAYGGSGANFNVPDLRGRAPVGQGTGSGLTTRTLGDQFGTETHTLSTSQMPSHTHGLTFYGNGSNTNNNKTAFGSRSANLLSTNAAGGGGAHNNKQPSTVVGFIIKT